MHSLEMEICDSPEWFQCNQEQGQGWFLPLWFERGCVAGDSTKRMVCGERLCLVILRAAEKGRQLISLKQKGFTREANVFRAVCCLVPEQQRLARLCSRGRRGELGMALALLFFIGKSHFLK